MDAVRESKMRSMVKRWRFSSYAALGGTFLLAAAAEWYGIYRAHFAWIPFVIAYIVGTTWSQRSMETRVREMLGEGETFEYLTLETSIHTREYFSLVRNVISKKGTQWKSFQ